nr:retrovirus-related Pol polyprotein from transposon TNT 1-94 [Tanacetum cinerariifolium]
MINKNDSEIVKAKVKRKSIALKAKKESSDEECLTSGSEDEEYAMAVRDFKKFFKRRECPKPPKDKNQRDFVGGSWSDSGEEDGEKVKDETCLVAHASSDVCFESSYFSDENSSIDDLALDNEFDKLCKISLKMITKNKRKIQNQLRCSIVSIRTDHDRQFDNEMQFGEFCNANGITHNFSAPRTPKSNGVVERKNKTLQEMSRTMLNEQSLPQSFWCNTVDTSTYILNRILIRAILIKTPYELLRGRKPTLDYFRVFGSKCFILNTKDYLTKFDPKLYEGVFLGYSQNSKAYIVLNKHTKKVKESLNVTFDETPPPSKTSPLVDDDLDEEKEIKVIEKKNLKSDIVDETLEIDEIVNIKESRNHPLENVLGNLNQRPYGSIPKQKNKLDKNGIVSRNKARLVSQGYNQQEAIDYDETYAPVARLESIRILLAYACALDFKLFQMDVKSAFLNDFINEEGTGIDTVLYADSDHAGDYVDQKTTSGICTFVGCCLTSWFSKKQTALARKACQQALWMKQALIDYDI